MKGNCEEETSGSPFQESHFFLWKPLVLVKVTPFHESHFS